MADRTHHLFGRHTCPYSQKFHIPCQGQLTMVGNSSTEGWVLHGKSRGFDGKTTPKQKVCRITTEIAGEAKSSGFKRWRPKIQWFKTLCHHFSPETCNSGVDLVFWANPSLIRQVAHTVNPFQCSSDITCKP